MMKYYYADVMEDGRIRGCFTYDGPDEGPLEPHWESQAEGTVVQLEAPISWAAPTETSVLHMVDGQQVWIEMAPLADVAARAIGTIDSAADRLRLEIISKQTNTEEYKRAEAQARAFKAAGYTGDAPSCVASWAKAKYRDGWTEQQAADDIIATADRWYGVLDAIRDLRLCAKEDVRHTADTGGIAARVAQFAADLQALVQAA